MTDRELLDRYTREDSAEAMCELVRRHIAMVRATAMRGVRDAHLADDITQAVFLVLMRKAGGLSSNVVLGGWLFRTTLYAVADARKKQARRQIHEREAGRMNPEIQSEENLDAARQELEPALNDAIAQLSAADRGAIVLRYLEGRATSEMAILLAATEPTVRKRLSRALERLRGRLREGGCVVSVGSLTAILESSKAHDVAGLLVSQVEACVHGAAPAAQVQSLIMGVLKMAQVTKYVVMGAIVGGVALLAGLGVTFMATRPQPAKPGEAQEIAQALPAPDQKPTPAENKPAAAAKFGPGDTAKITVVSAFAAARSGDADGFVSCFEGLSADQADTLSKMARTLPVVRDLSLAAGERFGADAGTRLLQTIGVNPDALATSAENGSEVIIGEDTTVKMGEPREGPREIPMIKVGAVWKIKAADFRMPNKESVEQGFQKIEAMQSLAADIKAGKFSTPGEIKPTLLAMGFGQK